MTLCKIGRDAEFCSVDNVVLWEVLEDKGYGKEFSPKKNMPQHVNSALGLRHLYPLWIGLYPKKI